MSNHLHHPAIRALPSLAILALLAALWFSGGVGHLMGAYIAPRLLPRPAGRDFAITRFEHASPRPPPDTGLVLRISPARLHQAAAEALPRAHWLIPPGLIRDGSRLDGNLALRTNRVELTRLPVTVLVDARAGAHPRLTVRYPVDDFNRLFDVLVTSGLHTREEYALGHYDLTYHIRFASFAAAAIERDAAPPVRQRELACRATGTVRVKLIENFFTATGTGEVKDLSGRLRLRPIRHDDGFGLNMQFTVDRLDADFHRVAPHFDAKIDKALVRVLEKALNRPKNRRKIAALRLPYWIPQDTLLDMQLTP